MSKFNNNNYDELSTREYLEGIFDGRIPVQGSNGMSYVVRNGDDYEMVPAEQFGQTYMDDENVYAPQMVTGTPNFRRKQAEMAARNQQYADAYDNANSLARGLREMDANDWKDVGRKALLGAEHVVDGATLGAYGIANDYFGGDYERQNDEMQRLAAENGLGRVYKHGTTILKDAAGGAASGTYGKIAPKINQAIPNIVRRYNRFG